MPVMSRKLDNRGDNNDVLAELLNNISDIWVSHSDIEKTTN